MEDLSREQVEGFLTDVQEYLRKEGIEVLEISGEEAEGEGVIEGLHETAARDVEAALADLTSLLAQHQPDARIESSTLQ